MLFHNISPSPWGRPPDDPMLMERFRGSSGSEGSRLGSEGVSASETKGTTCCRYIPHCPIRKARIGKVRGLTQACSYICGVNFSQMMGGP